VRSIFLQGLFELSAWGHFWVTLALTHITIAAVTIYLHRHQAHRGLTLHPVASHFFRFWLWLTTGMVTAEWVAVHRKHHAKCELEDDPHSPQQTGIASVLFGGTWLYRTEAAKPETLAGYSHGTPNDWIERHLYSRRRYAGIGLMLLIDVLLFGWAGTLIWLVQMVWIPFWAAGVINGIGHYWGYRNFETQDASRNIVPWGILIGGEELHNNHHAYGVSARLSNKWWEFDIGWTYIRLLEMLGMARVRRTAPKTSFASARPIDKETLKAVIANRFHVLKLYGKRVVGPVLRAEARKATGIAVDRLRWARKLVAKEGVELDARVHARLRDTLRMNETLETVYEFKQRLKALWTGRPKDTNDLLAKLQAWCADAEASGIAALQEFARQLQGYRSQLHYT
jgi:stearoyl-CoA desaturase (delta-9 desaturase)